MLPRPSLLLLLVVTFSTVCLTAHPSRFRCAVCHPRAASMACSRVYLCNVQMLRHNAGTRRNEDRVMLTRRVSQATAIITRTTTTNRRLIPSSRRHLHTNAPPMCPAFAAAWTRVWARPPLALQRNLEAEKQEKHKNPESSIHISLSTPPASLRATTTTAAAGCKTSTAPPATSRASSRTMVR